MSFVHLHVHSEYSLLRSTGKLEELVKQAKHLGYEALAITDIDAMYGVIPFYKACLKNNIKPIIGVELAYVKNQDEVKKDHHRLLFLAENNEGYQSLIRLTTRAQEKSSSFGPYVTYEELQANSNGVIAISPFAEGLVQQYIYDKQDASALQHFEWLQSIFGKENVFLELQNHWRQEEREKLLAISNWLKGKEDAIRVIASNHIHFTHKEQHDAHRAIQSIRLGIKLDELPHDYSSSEYYLKSIDEMHHLFKKDGEASRNTLRVADKCNVKIELGNMILPHFPLPNETTATEYLRELCYKGIQERYENPSEETWKRLDYELEVISEMKYEDYFLIVADFMRYAHEKKILTGPGRGSSAGSIVAYVLKITNVDPMKYGLIFERFLNRERISMPDIDIDFPDNRRDEVIRYVKEKYGRTHVAQIITFGTLAAKAAIRDVGRVLGIELPIIDKISKSIPSRPNITLENALKESTVLQGMIESEEKVAELFTIAKEVEGLPRHSSIHAAGIVMSKEPLTNVVPLQIGNDEMYLTQFPMGDIEDIGLLKMDFLGLRNLSFIEQILKLIHNQQHIDIELNNIPFHDVNTFTLLGKGQTSGVFQLESTGMRSVLKRLKPTEFEDIVAVNALYRPGPMENIPVYIRRLHKEEKVTYPHPSLEEILSPTYGVLIYQEQIMQIASKMAGFSLGEADILRRAVGKKKRDVLEEQRQKFVQGSISKGYDEKEANEMYNLILRFADYGFPRSHAVAYSIIAYYLAYLKANYQLEFMTALMGSVIHHHDKLGEYITEARRSGMKVHPPSIQQSEAQFSIKNKDIWIGLHAIKNVGVQAVQAILEERAKSDFDSLFDLCARIPTRLLPKRALDALIVAGALDCIHDDRAQLLASVDDAIEYGEKLREQEKNAQTELFIEEVKQPEYMSVPPLSSKDRLNFEKQVLGFYASGHPIESELALVESFGRLSVIDAKEKKSTLRIAGMIEDVKVIKTKKGDQMAFAQLSDETGEIDLTFFPEVYKDCRLKLQKGELVFVQGNVQEHKGEGKVVVEKCTTISLLKSKKAKGTEPTLYLKINALHEKKGLTALKKELEMSPGNVSVIIVYERTKKALHLSEMWNVSADERLLLKLRSLLGKENVYLKGHK
ncbi:DNA polymerase III subunit alpha [Evansella cellulosilytica]|uniref:DNA polymerase III subunit alpha n=1 Tax=Evansella cellulosilytica (strain ATCC 21833 / DSM 2522 / FERM P-1141 / JCM 9156 / N-4) TaxID=649639 RepID=E6U126_EVAC2|nr:DNA polymerase III subunit alpha [Evansella cellulosilytica]ADU31472.1 DNA polymerase III, alpha subunit [Evansella cellulosilytica DSM 2522]